MAARVAPSRESSPDMALPPQKVFDKFEWENCYGQELNQIRKMANRFGPPGGRPSAAPVASELAAALTAAVEPLAMCNTANWLERSR